MTLWVVKMTILRVTMSFPWRYWRASPLDLTRHYGHQDRFQRLITTLRPGAGVRRLGAAALDRQFIPLAIDGTARDVLGRRFCHHGRHPRWKPSPARGRGAFSPAGRFAPIRGGRVSSRTGSTVHACVGLPLFARTGNLIGALPMML